MATRPSAAARAAQRSASAVRVASGFSTKTSAPAASARRTSPAWECGGVAMSTASTPQASASSSEGTSAAPGASAAATARRAGRGSATATTRASRARDEHAEEVLPPGAAADERDADRHGAPGRGGARSWAGAGASRRASSSCSTTASDSRLPGWIEGPSMSTMNS